MTSESEKEKYVVGEDVEEAVSSSVSNVAPAPAYLIHFKTEEEFLAAESRFTRYMDFRILPILCFMYFFSFLDRSNMGNAKVGGMLTDLHMTQQQFSNCNTVVYATYVFFQVPSSIMLRLWKPNYYLAVMMFCWGMVTLFTIFCKNYGGMLVLRLLVGLFEGGFFSCLTIYVALCYKTNEICSRVAWLYMGSAISSAFGGLLMYGLANIKSGTLPGWKYLFLIEGVMTIVFAFAICFLLPQNVNSIPRTDEHRKVLEIREMERKKFLGGGFTWQAILNAFRDYKITLSWVIQFCIDVNLYGFSTFLPSILKSGLGYDNLASQYMTIPIYIVAAISCLLSCYAMERWGYRGPILALLCILGLIGYVILIAVKSNGVKLFACYLCAIALYTPGINEAWLLTNNSPHYKRATAAGINQAIGNIAGIAAPQAYNLAPYKKGYAVSIGAYGLAVILLLLNSYIFTVLNKRKQKLEDEGVEDDEYVLGDQSVHFRYNP